jgi:hypothetical protein
MNGHGKRKEEAIVTIEAAGDRVEPHALPGSRLRHALGQEGHAAPSEPSTPPSRRQGRRDASPAEGPGCVP